MVIRSRNLRSWLSIAVVLFAVATTVSAASPTPDDALALVRAHADAMLRYGTDHYGPAHTHFFPQMLDLRTLEAPVQRTPADWAQETKHWKEDTAYAAWGKFWNAAESPASANLGRDAEFLNALYDLSDLARDPKYAQAADAYLRDFLRLAIHPKTGFWATGAHLRYDLVEDRVVGRRHEMERQLVPYDRLWQMNRRAVIRYADAIMAGHFQDRARFGWNHHADWDTNNPGDEYGNFPEYGGGYAYLWAFAYTKTHDPRYREWIEKLAISYASKGDDETRRFPTSWWADRKLGNPITSRDNPGMAQLWLKACELLPDPWVLSSALAHLDDCYAGNPRWEQAAWSAYWQGKPWGGTTALLAYRLSGDLKYLEWARGFAERFDAVPRPKAMMAMMVAGNMDFFTQLYLATGVRRWLEKALDLVDLARRFAQPSGLFAGAVGLDRPLYYDATQGPGYLCEALLRLYRASLQPPDPTAYVRQRVSFPTITLRPGAKRWPGSQSLTIRAQIDAPLGVVNPRLEYTRDDVIGFSAPLRQVKNGIYEFVLPAMGSGFDGGVSLAVSAGNGRGPLNWCTSHWRQITVYPRETTQVADHATVTTASDVAVSVSSGGTLSVARYRWNPAAAEPAGALSNDYVDLSGTAVPARLTIRVRPETVQGMIAESIHLAHLRDGKWETVETQSDAKAGTLSTTDAAPGLWTVVGQSRVLWRVFEPNGYYSAAVGDLVGNGKLQLLMPANGRWGEGACGLIDGEGKVTFQRKDRLPQRGMRFSGPALADLNGDGAPEIIASSEDGNVWCIARDGIVLWNFETGGYCWTPVAAGDVNGDGRPEIAVSSDNHFVYLLDGAGNLLWKREADGALGTPPVLVEVDGDGALEILAGSDQGQVMALKANGASLWTYQAGAGVNGVTAADLDGDGRVECAVTLEDGRLVLLDAQGKLRWQYAWVASDPDQAALWQSVAGDINGDGKREIIVTTEDGHCLAISHAGKLLWSVNVERRANGCPTLLDLDHDGKYEVIVSSTASAIWALDGSGKTIWVFRQRGGGIYYTVAADLNGDGLVELFGMTAGGDICLRTEMRCQPYEIFWGMQRGDPRRSGVR